MANKSATLAVTTATDPRVARLFSAQGGRADVGKQGASILRRMARSTTQAVGGIYEAFDSRDFDDGRKAVIFDKEDDRDQYWREFAQERGLSEQDVELIKNAKLS